MSNRMSEFSENSSHTTLEIQWSWSFRNDHLEFRSGYRFRPNLDPKRKISRYLTFRFDKKLGQPLEMSCLRRTEILVEIVFQSYKKSWSEVLGTKWQTCIQNLPGPKQRFLVISQNWCGDFPPNLVITLKLLCLPQIQIFIEILLSLVKKSIDPLFWTLGSSGFVQNLSLFEFLMKDNSMPNLPIWIKFGSAGENVMLETHTNFGGKRLSKFQEIMVWSFARLLFGRKRCLGRKCKVVISKQPGSWYFEGLVRRYFTKLGQPMRHNLFVACGNFYQNPCEENWEIRR